MHSAKIVVEDINHTNLTLTAFSDVIEAIVSGKTGQSLAEKMLSTNSITLYISNNVIKSKQPYSPYSLLYYFSSHFF